MFAGRWTACSELRFRPSTRCSTYIVVGGLSVCMSDKTLPCEPSRRVARRGASWTTQFSAIGNRRLSTLFRSFAIIYWQCAHGAKLKCRSSNDKKNLRGSRPDNILSKRPCRRRFCVTFECRRPTTITSTNAPPCGHFDLRCMDRLTAASTSRKRFQSGGALSSVRPII